MILLLEQNQIKQFKDNQQSLTYNTSHDITKPRFTINNLNKKIVITANEGDFVNSNEILLKNKVLFKSKKFKIMSDNVLFDRKNQTAKSENNSIFTSQNTKINSEGFNIIQKGDVILFMGKTSLISSK